MVRVLTIFGTRPEAIKIAPVVLELRRRSDRVESVVCVTAQHREILDQVLGLFAIEPDLDLDLMEEKQSPALVTAKGMSALTNVLEEVRPDLVLVQGDTTTAMVAALAAFYQKIPVGHIEAGLRTRHRYHPFPEEINRHLIGVLSTHHFAPTETAAAALRQEGHVQEDIFITGNTVIDALLWVTKQPPSPATHALFSRLNLPLPPSGSPLSREGGGDLSTYQRTNVSTSSPSPPHTVSLSRLILVTAHRRENFGERLESICTALREIVHRNPQVQIVYPVHPNPNVREPVHRLLNGHDRLHLVGPLPYEPFVHLMKSADIILTDSGGIQEEAPALGKPVLVLREVTERPEAVEAGAVKVTGTDPDRLIAETERLLSDADAYLQMAQAVSPYGDGQASRRIIGVLLDEPVEVFVPCQPAV